MILVSSAIDAHTGMKDPAIAGFRRVIVRRIEHGSFRSSLMDSSIGIYG